MPATSANLGPGFDCLGLALDLFLNVTCRLEEATGVSIAVAGSESGGISTGADNPILTALELVYQQAGAQPPRGLALSIDNGIPLSRGLGSSAAAAAAGLMAGNGLLGEPFTRTELLDLGWRLEGHPDNLAPALLGGITASAIVRDRVVCIPIASPLELSVALFIPDFAMPTSQARAVLPNQVARADAVFNVGRASLLVAALAAGDAAALRWAMEDRLHQPYRAQLFPQLQPLSEAALAAGAAGVALSGAGSTVIALCLGNATGVAQAMATAAAALALPGRPLCGQVNHQGALVSTLLS